MIVARHTVAPPKLTAVTFPKEERVLSIDLLRGLVMIVMALDHVRDYFHWSTSHYDPLDFNHTSVPIFLTRLVTHYCAPTFVFLSGTSAFLTVGRKGKKGLSKFLFTRGLWLVFMEFTVINFGWDFNQVTSVIMLQTIWALGISMMALSALIYLPNRVLLVLSLIIITGHNALDNIHVTGNGAKAIAWSAIHDPRLFTFGNLKVLLAYPVLPWIGVMSAGYCFGKIFTLYKGAERKRILAIIGATCILLFIGLRLPNVYGDARPWAHQTTAIFTVLSFMNTTKYPPSLLFTLMTLGPSILFLAVADRLPNKLIRILSIYGRVPMFYYILHIYFIHIAFVLLALLIGYPLHEIFNTSILNPLPGWGFKLVIVYVIWLAIVGLLYPLCKRYDEYKRAHKQKWWLSYL